ncbi:MAG: hypothetical protein ACIAZJ_17170 [Gimesia chilikensis]|uniref:hypothetical protein n=1 Tax=Gimesia chilikensis TaxID=2605989 RepID=UPI003795874C
MDSALQFIIMLNTDLTISSIIKQMSAGLREARGRKVNSIDFEGNWIEIYQNDDYDESQTETEDGFLFYCYRLEATPLSKEITLSRQINTTRTICQNLQQLNVDIFLCANFEDQLPEFK